LITREVRIPAFFYISEGTIDRITEILRKEGFNPTKTLVISGSGFTKTVGDKIDNCLEGKTLRISINNSELSSIKQVEETIKNFDPSLVIGAGGGKVLDITKFCSYKQDKPFLSLPTVLSNDGVSSPISVVQTEDGIRSIGTNPPIGIVVDTDIIKKAPKETLLAGIGDLISNISAVEDWNLAGRYTDEKVDKFAEILAKNSAEGFIQYLTKNGGNSVSLYDKSILVPLAEGLIQSGIAMSLAGSSRPCSGSEHLISHALDKLLDFAKPHGQQVGLATLFTNALRGKEIADLRNLYKTIDFPTTPQALGIDMATFREAIKIAPMTRKDRFTILNIASEDEIEKAIKIAYAP
jgi:glycerol-1-phosphate dehydrogenase [NAD(P)+]